MKPSPDAHAAPSNRRLAVRAFLITLLLGPLAGGLVFLVPITIGAMADMSEGAVRFAEGIAKLWLMVVLMAYLMGGMSALIAAVVLAWRILKKGAVRIRFLLANAVVSGFLGVIVLDRLIAIDGARAKPFETELVLGAEFALISLVSAVLLLPVAARSGILKRAVKREA